MSSPWLEGKNPFGLYNVSKGKSEFSSKNISILSVVRKLGTVSSNFET